jgi:hypothetical protein
MREVNAMAAGGFGRKARRYARSLVEFPYQTHAYCCRRLAGPVL